MRGRNNNSTTLIRHTIQKHAASPPDPDYKIQPISFEENDKNKIGKGKYAEVYSANHNNQLIAIKTIKATGKNSPEREIKVMSEIETLREKDAEKTKNLISFLGYWQTNEYFLGKFYLAIEYANLGSFYQFIEDKNNKSNYLVTVENIALQVAHGLNCLHGMGWVHADLKPHNILLLQEENKITAKIADFGVTRSESDSPENPMSYLVGSLAYMAPEILLTSAPPSFKSDVFSFSITILQSVVHTPLYKNKNLDDLIEMMSNEEREPIPEDCPPRMRRVIATGWQQNPAARPTASQLIADLEEPLSPSLRP